MVIGGLQKTTLIDYPNKIACTIFLAGCNFRCPWCYSAELVLPEKIKEQPKISEKEIFNFLEEKKGLLGGVVLCGGEPTVQKGLSEFAGKIKKMGFLVKLDTNGSNPEILEGLINKKLIDYVAIDIKLPKERYSMLWERVEDIQKSINILQEGKIDYEFRTTAVPTIHKKEDFLKIAKWIGGKNVKYYLQNYRPDKTLDSKFEKLKPCPDKYLLEIKNQILKYFKVCEIR